LLDIAPSISSGLERDFIVGGVSSAIVDVPTVRSHTSVTAQNYVIVRLQLANGVEGIGEAATLGGPRSSEESVEPMKANIDAYLIPAVLGVRADRFEAAGQPYGPSCQARIVTPWHGLRLSWHWRCPKATPD
jgi:muconate cycloisomerase